MLDPAEPAESPNPSFRPGIRSTGVIQLYAMGWKLEDYGGAIVSHTGALRLYFRHPAS